MIFLSQGTCFCSKSEKIIEHAFGSGLFSCTSTFPMQLIHTVLQQQNNETVLHCSAGISGGASALAIWLETQLRDSETHSLLHSSRTAEFRNNSGVNCPVYSAEYHRSSAFVKPPCCAAGPGFFPERLLMV